MLKGETNMSQEEILDEKYEMDSPDSGNETIAAKSIKAKGQVTDTQMADSKSSMMNGMMSAMAAMPKEQVANIPLLFYPQPRHVLKRSEMKWLPLWRKILSRYNFYFAYPYE